MDEHSLFIHAVVPCICALFPYTSLFFFVVYTYVSVVAIYNIMYSLSIMFKSKNDKACSLLKVWEVPMLMCVDSCPVVVRFGIKTIVVCASQAGGRFMLLEFRSALRFLTNSSLMSPSLSRYCLYRCA